MPITHHRRRFARTAAISSGKYAAAVLAQGPQAFYKLDELDGTTAADSSGNVRHGTYAGGIARHGIEGVTFDGTSGRVELPGAATFNSRGFSWSGWVRWTETNDQLWSMLFNLRRANNGNRPCLYFTPWASGTAAEFAAYPSAGVSLTNWQFPQNAWVHAAVTWDGDTMRAYLQGAEYVSAHNANDMTAAEQFTTMTLGAQGSDAGGYNSFYGGDMAGVGFWTRALTAAEVAAQQAAGRDTATVTPTPGAAAYPAAVMADAPSAYWRLGEESGAALDSSGNGRAAAWNGTPGRHAFGALAVGDDGAAALNGASWATATDSAAFDTPAGTVECWVKTSGTGAWDSGYSGVVTLQGAWGLYLRYNQPTAHDFGGGGIRTAPIAIADNAWHHLAMSWGDGTCALYIDGTLALTAPYSAGAGTRILAIGAGSYDNGYAQGFNGSIDEVAVYPARLSAARIAAHYAAGH